MIDGKVKLSKRENQILALLTKGWSDKQVARELDISEATVKVHNKRLRRKTGLTSRTALATAFLTQRVAEMEIELTVLRNRWNMINQLRADEGHSVELIHDNPDFGGPNCVVHVSTDYGQNHDAYYGDTIDDCLQKAIAAQGAKNDQMA